MGVRDWLRLFRAQTAPATVFSIVVPYLLANGDIVNLLWLVPLAILIHFASFGHNSLMDYWYDIADPNKRHHPLVTKTISYRRANQVINLLMVVLGIIASMVALKISPRPHIALLFLLMYIVWGHAYNDGLDKNWVHSWLPISACFASLALYGYYLGPETNATLALILYVWAFLAVFYQIAVEGNLKDLWNPKDEGNLLKSFGAIVVREDKEWVIECDKLAYKVFIIASAIVRLVSTFIVAILALTMFKYSTLQLIVFLVMHCITTFIETVNVSRITMYALGVKFTRDDMLACFGKAEAFEFFRFMTVMLLTNTWWIYFIVLLYGLAWFVGMNKYLWNTRFGPRV